MFCLQVEQLDKEVDKHERLTPEERDEITANVEEVSKQWAELNNLLSGKFNLPLINLKNSKD